MAIEIRNLRKSYGSQEVLKSINIAFQKNTITGLIGFNGSGKTTTFNIMANFIEDFTGEVLFDGAKPTQALRQRISYLAAGSEPKNPQKVMTHFMNIAFMYGMHKQVARERIQELATRVELTPFLAKPIKALSKGNQQKLKVVTALLNPHLEYLFLDEPFDGLDPIMVRKIQKLFMELSNVTIIITSHQMEVVQEMCSEFYLLKDGVLVDARRSDDKTVTMVVNKEVNLEVLAKVKGVSEIIAKDNVNMIVLDDVTFFRPINALLIKDNKYVFSSLKEKNIAETVFARYAND